MTTGHDFPAVVAERGAKLVVASFVAGSPHVRVAVIDRTEKPFHIATAQLDRAELVALVDVLGIALAGLDARPADGGRRAKRTRAQDDEPRRPGTPRGVVDPRQRRAP